MNDRPTLLAATQFIKDILEPPVPGDELNATAAAAVIIAAAIDRLTETIADKAESALMLAERPSWHN